MSLELIPHEGGLDSVRLVGHVTHQCPYEDELDHGTFEIVYYPKEHLVELRSLDEYMEAFREMEVSHEELTQAIARDFSAAVQCDCRVDTFFATAGIEITSKSSARLVCGPDVTAYGDEDDPHLGLPLK